MLVSRITEIAVELVKSPVGDLTIPDTIGVAVPPQVTMMWNALRPVVGDVPLQGAFPQHAQHHRHRQCLCRGRGRSHGGQPPRSGRHRRLPLRAQGDRRNVATEDVLYLLDEMGIETGVSLDGLIDTARWLEPQLGHALAGMVARAGGFPAPRTPTG